jgi:hypothetical protein
VSDAGSDAGMQGKKSCQFDVIFLFLARRARERERAVLLKANSWFRYGVHRAQMTRWDDRMASTVELRQDPSDSRAQLLHPSDCAF